ncbi:type IV secretory system conjugative DNA transfer family protein [Bosea sp. (in: a-proteobacteria)]|uniref:type IV secretory system conjugative DNA transfer family protein n=1 Tax=Bosea sp. (in: a-proteobacteria) TaxID=1871050 RepID=UPI002B45C144|nr:type IV secretion system DNA-binding domain-containing protein [Bosea sp. (in: a-proteobacteria)]WRH58493.1 MAG: type IV secretion system DNA-binding domain-containing protein [Bosea sp. (in: a-proteobacteria)]
MSDTPISSSLLDDKGTFVLYLLLGACGAAALGPAGLISMMLPTLLYRLTHRPNWVFLSLFIALALLLAQWLSSDLGSALLALPQALLAVFKQPSQLESFRAEWLASFWSPVAWATSGTLGLALGALPALVTSETEHSALDALMRGQTPDVIKRAPLAPWFHRMVEARPANRGNAVVVGSDWRTGAAVVVTENDLNRHMLVVGTTGAGKTTALLNMIEASPMGTVIVDGKGDLELAHRVVEIAGARGQKAYLFDATGGEYSAVYNPVASGDFTSLTDRIMTMRVWSEPHYRTLAEGFAQTAFKVMQACKQPVDLLTAAHALDTKFLTNMLRRTSKGGETFAELAAEITAQRTAEPHVEGLRADLRNLAGSVFARLFDTSRARAQKVPVIVLTRARKEGAIVYFCLPRLKYPDQAAKLGKLIINDIKFAASGSDQPWRIILDEFSTFAGPQVLNVINQGRSHGLSAVLATQSLADIAQGAESDGRSFTDQLIGSINTFIVYRLNTPSDCELMAGVAGTHEQVEFTAQTAGGVGTGGASARHTRQYRVHPDTFKNLDVGEAILINKNAASSVRYGMLKARRSSA